MLRRADEGVRPGQRSAAICERYLVDHRLRAGVVGDHHDLDADVAGGVVEAEPAQLAEHWGRPLAAYQRCRGSQDVSSSSFDGTSVVWWISATSSPAPTPAAAAPPVPGRP